MKKIIAILFLIIPGGSLVAQDIQFTNGNNDWDADSLGNHRAVVVFTGTGNIARTIIEWRRRDTDTWNKRIIVQDAKTKQKIPNVKAGVINNERGEIWFEPLSGKGDYYIYYMPSKNEGRSNYPKGVYWAAEDLASEEWKQLINEKIPVNTTVKEIQAINAFNSFYPMEVIATTKETATLISKSNRSDYLVFPEDRLNPAKMTDRLPYRWIKNGIKTIFQGEALRGEYYTYQLCIYALQDLKNITVEFSDLKNEKGNIIAAKNISCINTTGVDYTGLSFTKTIDVEKNKVQSLWCGIDLSSNTIAGIYKGHAIIKATNAAPAIIAINLVVKDKQAIDHGFDEPWKQARLKWLNSTLAQENTVIDPYTALQVENNSISLLGRKVEVGNNGFPVQIQTFFNQEMDGYQSLPNNMLVSPIHFIVSTTTTDSSKWKSNGLQFTRKEAGTVQWKATNTNDDWVMDVNASLEFDGFITYTVKFTAIKDVQVKDIALAIPFNKMYAKYMMGLGRKGGYRPALLEWKWDVANKNQDGAWIGNVNAGLQYSLRDENYVRPLNTNFYLQKPLLLPSSWGNGNKGGINMEEKGDTVVINNYSGERKMKKGDVLYYNFTLLITPFHPIDTDFQWATRFYHKYDNLDTIKKSGATVANIHHATAINPWINYPFIEYKRMRSYIDSAHAMGLKVKIYNTVRELSDHAYELFPLRSLGHEIFSTGKGGGFSWLQEHIGEDYIPAWFVPGLKDAAMVNSGVSRWHNYYVEGMNWLVQQVGIDGIYLDDVAFDRVTMKRIKRVLTQNGHPGIIDLHSANQYNRNDGFNNSANLYMEHFPYLNRLWFGEYFDYEKNGPDFFLTEVSGIPFGLMGEMLQDGGNAWRGMIYGMTSRYPWDEQADPRPIWKCWDEFGMQGTKMIGYWSDNCPVKTNNDKILATVYKKKGAALISIASWADSDQEIKLSIDWNKLGIDPTRATLIAKEIKNFQQVRVFKIDEPIPVEKGKGWLLIVK